MDRADNAIVAFSVHSDLPVVEATFELCSLARPLEPEMIVLIGSLVRIAVVAMLCALAVTPASSRQWKATPEALARDYATINDTRSDGQLVLLIWFVPQMVRPDAPNAGAMIGMLQKNIVLLAVHGRLDRTSGTMSFEDVEALDAKDQNGRALASLARDALPPLTIGAITTIETMFRQSLGTMGKGMKVFLYDGAGVDACGKGRLSVSVANETYTWDTPFPSCQAK
jgi:hypothetical protein